MNIYHVLNECINYIEEHLENEIDYQHISKMFGCSESIMQRFFSLLCGITLKEYIRRRKLTIAVSDIRNHEKIIDVALKYGYSSDISFSRSFKKMHGVLPSKIKNNSIDLDMQPILKFEVPDSHVHRSYFYIAVETWLLARSGKEPIQKFVRWGIEG